MKPNVSNVKSGHFYYNWGVLIRARSPIDHACFDKLFLSNLLKYVELTSLLSKRAKDKGSDYLHNYTGKVLT